MNETITISAILERVDPKNKASVTEAASQLFSKGIKPGATVAVVGDEGILPYEGVKGKVMAVEGAYARVKMPNGHEVPLMLHMLHPVK